MVHRSVFGGHVFGFKDHMESQFAGRPTGRPRPDIKGFKKALEKKYKQAWKNIKLARPTGRPLTNNEKDNYEDAKDLVWRSK